MQWATRRTHDENNQCQGSTCCGPNFRSKLPAFGFDLPPANLYPSQTMIFGAVNGIRYRLCSTRSSRSVLGLDGTGLVVMITVMEGPEGPSSCTCGVVGQKAQLATSEKWPSQAFMTERKELMLGGLQRSSST